MESTSTSSDALVAAAFNRSVMAHLVDAGVPAAVGTPASNVRTTQLTAPDLASSGEVDLSMISGSDALVSPGEREFDLLTGRLRSMVEDGRGECIYDVGVPLIDEEGGSADAVRGLNRGEMAASVATLESIADTALGAEIVLLREKTVGESEEGRFTAQYLVRRRYEEKDFMEIRIAVVGNVDAGKSTLLGVLTHGELDNGRGFARQKLFRHKHEAESGRTSSVGNDILGFDSAGRVVNRPEHGNLDWVRVCEQSSKVITFIDLAGHEKYLKTTVFGMTGHAPDFGKDQFRNVPDRYTLYGGTCVKLVEMTS